MKKYKLIVPIALIAFFFMGTYMMISSNLSKTNEYNSCLEVARNCEKLGIIVDAEENFLKALNIKESLDLRLEVENLYINAEEISKAAEWGETVVEKYPKNSEPYETLMQIYEKEKEYVECFKLNDKAARRKVKSDKLSEIFSKIEYEYFFDGQFLDVSVFCGDLCAVKANEKWGYVNTSGKKVIDSEYSSAGPFSNDVAAVNKNGDCYYIDKEGNKKIVVKDVEGISNLGKNVNGIFPVFANGKWAFYNTKIEKLFGDFDEASALTNGFAAVKKDLKWDIINEKGEIKSNNSFEEILINEKGTAYTNERLFARTNSKINMIDSSGKAITDNSFDDAKLFNDETYAAVKTGEKWGFIDKDGKIVIEAQYDDARSFSNGYAAVKKDGSWGFINKENKIVIDCIFDDAKDFNKSGCVFIKNKDEWNLLKLFKYNH